MLSQDDLERERYKARMRVLRDENSRLFAAHQKGIEQGLVRGLEQGRKDEAISILLRLLLKKFGSVDPLVSDKIRELDRSQLEQLGEDLLDLNSKDELIQCLSQKCSTEKT